MTGCWPNTFIVGAGKSGTTSLHRYLDQHPEIFMSDPKEPHFFTRTWELEADDLEQAKAAYRALFEDGCDHPVRGEASPSYLFHPPAPERIHAHVPDARILVTLRDPVQRAYSHFLFHAKTRTHLQDFYKAMLRDEGRRLMMPKQEHLSSYFDGRLYFFVEMGRYANHVERYLDIFGRDQIHVVLLARLSEDPVRELERVAAFLDVDPDPFEQIEAKRHNRYHGPANRIASFLRTDPRVKWVARRLVPLSVREWFGDNVLIRPGDKPEMEPEAAELLETVYGPQVSRLERMLGEPLDELRASWSSNDA